MTTLMFRERFAAPIIAGTKSQTIRPARKRPIKIGDQLSLRKWAGKAYRSPQVEFAKARCVAYQGVQIREDGIWLGFDEAIGGWARVVDLEGFAQADGFSSWAEMRSYFDTPPDGYGLPFIGVLILFEVAAK